MEGVLRFGCLGCKPLRWMAASLSLNERAYSGGEIAAEHPKTFC